MRDIHKRLETAVRARNHFINSEEAAAAQMRYYAGCVQIFKARVDELDERIEMFYAECKSKENPECQASKSVNTPSA
jgi:hypothetical protein